MLLTRDPQSELEFVDTALQYKLFELDLQSAVNTAFYTEVSISLSSYYLGPGISNYRNPPLKGSRAKQNI